MESLSDAGDLLLQESSAVTELQTSDVHDDTSFRSANDSPDSPSSSSRRNSRHSCDDDHILSPKHTIVCAEHLAAVANENLKLRQVLGEICRVLRVDDIDSHNNANTSSDGECNDVSIYTTLSVAAPTVAPGDSLSTFLLLRPSSLDRLQSQLLAAIEQLQRHNDNNQYVCDDEAGCSDSLLPRYKSLSQHSHRSDDDNTTVVNSNGNGNGNDRVEGDDREVELEVDSRESWKECTEVHPSPPFDFDSPVVEHIMHTWSEDHNKVILCCTCAVIRCDRLILLIPVDFILSNAFLIAATCGPILRSISWLPGQRV
jgi:hypothetical protein